MPILKRGRHYDFMERHKFRWPIAGLRQVLYSSKIKRYQAEYLCAVAQVSLLNISNKKARRLLVGLFLLAVFNPLGGLLYNSHLFNHRRLAIG
jgi:hypothetical protein